MLKKTLSIAGLLAALSVGSANAATVFSDDFSSYGPTTVLNATSTTFGGVWTTTPSIDYLAAGSAFGDLCQGLGNCVDLDGSSGSAGEFATSSVFSAGQYELSFTLLGSGRDTVEDVTVFLGNVGFIFSGIASSDVITFSDTFTVATAGTLRFQNAGGDNIGAILSSVSLAAVPIPAAGFLLLAALGGLAAARRRKSA